MVLYSRLKLLSAKAKHGLTPDRSKHAIQLRITFYIINERLFKEKQYLYISTRYNVCCVIIETQCVDFNQSQTHHYEQRNKNYFGNNINSG